MEYLLSILFAEDLVVAVAAMEVPLVSVARAGKTGRFPRNLTNVATLF